MSARVFSFPSGQEVIISQPKPRQGKPKGYNRALELLNELHDTTEAVFDSWLDTSNEFHAIITTPSGHDFGLTLDYHSRLDRQGYRVSMSDVENLGYTIEEADRQGLTEIILTK